MMGLFLLVFLRKLLHRDTQRKMQNSTKYKNNFVNLLGSLCVSAKQQTYENIRNRNFDRCW